MNSTNPPSNSTNPASQTPPHFNYSTRDKVALDFREGRPLGNGSFGFVDEVICQLWPLRGQPLARKRFGLPEHAGARAEEKGAILEEVKHLTSAKHAHTVEVVCTYEYQQEFAVLMRPVADMDLSEYLRSADSHFEDGERVKMRLQIRQWFGCLLCVTMHLHRNDIRHMDIKPSNILLKGDKLLLTDFGLSLQFPGDTVSGITDPRGTRMYWAPGMNEDSVRRSYKSADIFSLGAVFFEMLVVYSGKRQLEKFRKQMSRGGYASNLPLVMEWISQLKVMGQASSFHPLYDFMLDTCREMLQEDLQKRPQAIQLWQWWVSWRLAVPLCSNCIVERDGDVFYNLYRDSILTTGPSPPPVTRASVGQPRRAATWSGHQSPSASFSYPEANSTVELIGSPIAKSMRAQRWERDKAYYPGE